MSNYNEVYDEEVELKVNEVNPRGRAVRRLNTERHKSRLIKSLENHQSRYCSIISVKESKKGDKFISRPKNSDIQQFHKKASARKIRKTADIPCKGNGARKAYDYKWNID